MSTRSFDVRKEFLRASQKGDLELLKDLVSKNRVSNWTKYSHEISGDTPLHLAAREGHLEVVKFLCEWWTEPYFKEEVKNKDMKRPLHEAAQFARLKVLEYLIERGADIDPLKRADWTPLMLACTKTGAEAARCVEALINRGAALNFRNKDGWTPLLIASRAGNVEAVKSLIKIDPKCVKARSKNGRSPLHVAAFHGHSDVIDLLLLEEPNLANVKDSSGSTPLLESIKSGDLGAVKRLIERGADVKEVDNMAQNILHYAAQAGDTKIIKFILDNQFVDVNARASFDITPLMLAEKNQQLEAVEILKDFTKHLPK